MDLAALIGEIADPNSVLTHLPYALLVLSMLMNDMGWLRAIAIAAGVIRIVNRAFIDTDPIVVLWESIFVAVNVGQLLILWYYARRHRFTADEQRLLDSLPADTPRRTARRLINLSARRLYDPGAVLTTEGQAVARLVFITDGVVQIERGEQIVAVCGPGDYIGEMSFVTGAPATATARAARALACFEFDHSKLRLAANSDSELRRALEAAFGRNLAGKLGKSGSPLPLLS